MNINRLKNISILLLAFFAIFQTVQLWFENISNRNFFYTFFNSITSNEVVYVKVKPYRIITNMGNGLYEITASDLINTEEYQNCERMIERLMSDGEYIASADLQWLEMLKSPSYIIEYGTSMPNEIFTRGYSKGGNIATKLNNKVDNIIIEPTEKGVKAVFIETENNTGHEFFLKNSDMSDDILNSITQTKIRFSGIYYISSFQNNLTALAKNAFIPRWDSSGYGYTPLLSDNPYASGEKHIKIIEKNIMYLFENPSGIWSNKVNNVYTYSDKNRVVKYYDNDVLEYNDFTVSKEDAGRSFMRDYSAAIRFLNDDIYLSNDFYLTEYKIGENDTTFFFNYTINDLPISFSSEFRDDTGMNHPIEITVDNGHIIYYKRIAHVFYNDSVFTAKANLDFMGSLNSIFPTEEDLLKSNLQDIDLAYKVDKNKQLLLYWFLNLDDILYVKST